MDDLSAALDNLHRTCGEASRVCGDIAARWKAQSAARETKDMAVHAIPESSIKIWLEMLDETYRMVSQVSSRGLSFDDLTRLGSSAGNIRAVRDLIVMRTGVSP